MQATTAQKKIIHTITPTRDIKEEWVQWATGDVTKTSTNDLNFEQANKILVQNNCKPHKEVFYAAFSNDNSQHKKILSLCIQYGWFRKSAKYGKVANLDKLDEWLKGEMKANSPILKPLKKMKPQELSKVVFALENMILQKFS